MGAELRPIRPKRPTGGLVGEDARLVGHACLGGEELRGAGGGGAAVLLPSLAPELKPPTDTPPLLSLPSSPPCGPLLLLLPLEPP